jgi:tetratricopeptide (TPR) repeat protein
MNNHLTINDLLDQWVKNEITFDELALRSGKEDLSELQENMEMHQLAVHAIQKHSTAVQVSSIHQKYLNKRKEQEAPAKVVSITNNRSRIVLRVASAAAVFAALLVSAQLLFVSSNRVYSETFTSYHVNNVRSADAFGSGAISELFQKGDYKGVVSAFKSGEAMGNREVFLAGYASLILKDYDHAIDYFNVIIDNTAIRNTSFRDEAEYYLTLANLRAGKHEEAYRMMKRIYSNPEHTYHDAFDKWTMFRMKWIR